MPGLFTYLKINPYLIQLSQIMNKRKSKTLFYKAFLTLKSKSDKDCIKEEYNEQRFKNPE